MKTIKFLPAETQEEKTRVFEFEALELGAEVMHAEDLKSAHYTKFMLTVSPLCGMINTMAFVQEAVVPLLKTKYPNAISRTEAPEAAKLLKQSLDLDKIIRYEVNGFTEEVTITMFDIDEIVLGPGENRLPTILSIKARQSSLEHIKRDMEAQHSSILEVIATHYGLRELMEATKS